MHIVNILHYLLILFIAFILACALGKFYDFIVWLCQKKTEENKQKKGSSEPKKVVYPPELREKK